MEVAQCSVDPADSSFVVITFCVYLLLLSAQRIFYAGDGRVRSGLPIGRTASGLAADFGIVTAVPEFLK